MIFHRNESVSCLYLIWLNVLIIYDVTLTFVIMSGLHHFASWINSVVCLWILYVMSWSNPVMCYIHIITGFCHVQFCTLTVHISIYFCHAQLCTNDFQYDYRFFVMYISVQMTIYILLDFRDTHVCTDNFQYSLGFSSCASLYEWLSIFY